MLPADTSRIREARIEHIDNFADDEERLVGQTRIRE